MVYKGIHLIGYICGAGASTSGPEHGPYMLCYDDRISDVRAVLRRSDDSKIVDWDIDPAVLYGQQKQHYIQLPALGTPERKAIVLQNVAQIADRVEQSIQNGFFPVTIGGDHSLSAGSIAGFARAHKAHGRVGVIWVDAHADINSYRLSGSKAYHGMPLWALMGFGDPDFAGIAGGAPVLLPENLVYIGLRDVDPAEQEFIDQHNILVFTVDDVHKRGAEQVWREALAHLSGCDYRVLSTDIDAFDPGDGLATGTPVPDGLDATEFLDALQSVMHAPSHAGPLPKPVFDMVEVVEFNPALPNAKHTAELAIKILDSSVPDV